MAQRIGQTPAVNVERTNIRNIEYVVLREAGDASKTVMFPAHQLGEIQEILLRFYSEAYTKDSLKHTGANWCELHKAPIIDGQCTANHKP